MGLCFTFSRLSPSLRSRSFGRLCCLHCRFAVGAVAASSSCPVVDAGRFGLDAGRTLRVGIGKTVQCYLANPEWMQTQYVAQPAG